jgi:hypothetical protein
MSELFKYQKEIQQIQELGVCCPPDELSTPNQLRVYRFVFENSSTDKNHIPPGAINPKRILTEKEQKKCSLYGLSCFTGEVGAKQFFSELSKHNPKFYKAVGETLSTGVLNEDDGLITEEDVYTHLDLFEFESCDLSTKFTSIEKLI